MGSMSDYWQAKADATRTAELANPTYYRSVNRALLPTYQPAPVKAALVMAIGSGFLTVLLPVTGEQKQINVTSATQSAATAGSYFILHPDGSEMIMPRGAFEAFFGNK